MIAVRGQLLQNASLKKMSRLGVGGCADYLFTPEDMDDLVTFLRKLPDDIPITVLGAMSNVLVRSGGIRGVVIMLGSWFKNIYEENGILEAGAALSCAELSVFAVDHNLGGLEFLMGIPGSIGGAIRMNAGCYGAEIFDILQEYESITPDGSVKWVKANQVEHGYRYTNLPEGHIITRAWFKANVGVDYSISRKLHEIAEARRNSQPLDKRSCGSAFKNPAGMKAWQLISDAGCRGMRLGGALVSEKHCNFIVNDGNATPEDIEKLGEQIIEKVYDKFGIKLEWEIIRIGERSH